ncbi:MAG TPA: hypothetical protein VMA72_00740 [Streptosporangiaceae bacterium]|nr:hypothetical protein [Streptosporangiaceae bacterium]
MRKTDLKTLSDRRLLNRLFDLAFDRWDSARTDGDGPTLDAFNEARHRGLIGAEYRLSGLGKWLRDDAPLYLRLRMTLIERWLVTRHCWRLIRAGKARTLFRL